MTSREELLQSIHPGMQINKAFFLRIYGYELTWPGFAETAIKALADAGCSKARLYYDSIVSEYERGYHERIREVGKWYLEECKKRQKGSEEQRKERRRMRRQSWTELSEILNFQPTAKAQ